jgi:hypothetical protein
MLLTPVTACWSMSMLRVLWLVCLFALVGLLGCGDDDTGAAAGAGSGGATDSGAHANSGSGGAGSSASGGSGHAGNGSGGQGSGGATSGSGGIGSGSGGIGSGSGGTGIDVDAPTARTAACLEYVRGFCEGQLKCSGGVDDASVRMCMWRSGNTCPDLIFAEGSSRTVAGSIECAQAWRDQPCAERVLGLAPDCAISGTLPGGAKCISGFQCASRGCDARGESCATCTTLVAEGGACDAMHSCPDEDECTGSVCVRAEPLDAGVPVMAPDLKLGDVCDRSAGGCGLTSKYDCWPDTDGIGHCIPYPRLGEDCSMQHDCERGNSYCDISGKCLAVPAEGQPCGVDSWTGVATWCADSLFCDASVDPDVCRQPPGPGEACAIGGCRAGYSCMLDPPDMTTTKCLRQRLAGESCTDANDRCLPGATRCEGGVCALVESQGLYESLCMP